jgi:hypothetical protein
MIKKQIEIDYVLDLPVHNSIIYFPLKLDKMVQAYKENEFITACRSADDAQTY